MTLNLTGTVGRHGGNAIHDVAIIQAMLTFVHRPAFLDRSQRAYFRTIHGTCDQPTISAIKQFQADQVLVERAASSDTNKKPPESSGLVTSRDETWKALVAAVPAQYRLLRALPGSKIVYVEASSAALAANVAAANALTFESEFAGVVIELMQRIHLLYGIAISVNDDGDRRTFQKQFELATGGTGSTGSGPGESNHNFGRAVDLGFKQLQWLQSNGVVVSRESSMLDTLDPGARGAGQARYFWNMLRAEGRDIGMWPSLLTWDRPHLQDFNDGINSAQRLGVLLNGVSVRDPELRWTGHTVDKHRHYECDLGCGGQMFNVGGSKDIWRRRAAVTVQMLNKARAQPTNRTGQTAAATPHDVEELRNDMRLDFEAADLNWRQWTAT